MSDNVEELTQEQYNAGREAGEIDPPEIDDVENELDDEPAKFEKPAESEKPKEEEKPPPRPWERKEGDGTQGGIPNARWAANRIEQTKMERELEAARIRLAELEAGKQEEITDPSKLDKSKYTAPDGTFDADRYLADRDKIVAANLKREIDQEYQAREHQKSVDALVSSYIQAVNEEAKTNPEIIKAVRELDKFGPQMHPAVATKLMQLPPSVSFAVACNDEYLNQLVFGNPIDSLALLGELKATSKKEQPKAPEPQQVQAFKPAAKHVPKALGSGGATHKDPDQETQEEYNRRRLREMRR